MAYAERRSYAVTREHRERFFVVGDQMAAEPEQRQHDDEDPLVSSELERRLRRMDWPPAPSEVKARVLARVMERSSEELGRGEDARPAGSATDFGD